MNKSVALLKKCNNNKNMDENEKLKFPEMFCRAHFEPKTFNEANNSMDVIFSTGAKVRRHTFDGPVDVELAMEPKNVRLDRFNRGAPVLDNHGTAQSLFGPSGIHSLKDIIGVVESAEVDGKKGKAKVRFSDREEIKGLVNDIKTGIIRNISIGLIIHKAERIEPKTKKGVPILRAIDWEPMELSFVAIPADAKAQVRSEENKLYECEIISTKGEQKMDPINNEETKTEAPKVEVRTEIKIEKVVDEKEVQIRVDAELARRSDIKLACRMGGFDETKTKEFIDGKSSADEVRKLVMEKMAIADEKKVTHSASVEVNDEKVVETRNAGIINSLLYRANVLDEKGEKYKLDDNGRRFRNMTCLDIGRELLEAKGVNCRNLTKNEIAKRSFQTSSDFPELLANVANKTLRAGYEAAQQTFLPFTNLVTANDFKEISRTQFGEGSELEEVLESGEYKKGAVGEAAEKYKVKKYGKIYPFSFEAMINDDLRAFARMPQLAGQRARDLESDLVWGIITANANMADGNALFSTAHSNITASGGAPSIDEVSKGRTLMRQQIGLDAQKIAVRPIWIYVPTTLETKAEQLVTSIISNDIAKSNPFGPGGRTQLQIGIESRLDDNSALEWYLMAALAQIDMIELARLLGEEGPVIETRNGFEIDGMELKVRHIVGAKAIDHRGLYRNAGA